MSDISDLSGSTVMGDEVPTTLSTTTFTYVKGSNDLTEYALDFMKDEVSYFSTIYSYTRDEKVTLYICENGLITSSASYSETGSLREHFRMHDISENEFTSIQDWYTD